VVLTGVPAPDEAEREGFLRAPWPVAPAPDGSHLQVEWNRTRAAMHENAALEVIAGGFADSVANGPHASWGLQAAMQYPAAERLRLIVQPTLLLRSRDGRGAESNRARELLPKARAVEQAEIYGSDLFESAATQVSGVLREFLRG
jgi:hypothetical protein